MIQKIHHMQLLSFLVSNKYEEKKDEIRKKTDINGSEES